MIIFIILLHNGYKNQKERDLQSNVQTVTKTYKLFIEQFLDSIYKEYQFNNKSFYNIHQYAQNAYLNNPNISLNSLKNNIKKHFSLNDFDIDIFLLDETYTITNATFEKDIGFNLSKIEDAKMYLDKTSKDSKIYVASNISIDRLEYVLKVYSYSKIKEGKYFEMGFKFDNPFYKDLSQNLEDIFQKTNNKLSLFSVSTAGKYQYRIDLLYKPHTSISKKEYEKTIEKFDIGKLTDDPFINAIRSKQIQNEIADDRYLVYVPLITKEDSTNLFYNSIGLKIDIDIAPYNESLAKTNQKFILFGIIIFVFLSVLYYFIRFSFYESIKRITNFFEKDQKVTDTYLLSKNDEFGVLVEKYNTLFDKFTNEVGLNTKLLEDNKRFIADTVHQIRTPLTNIMMNGEMIKKFQKDDSLSSFVDKIDSSINMLSDSYENLAYLTTYDSIEYNPVKLSLSDAINQKTKFFETISKVNQKKIISNIHKDINIFMNQIELERIIDNNISNSIKYGTKDRPIIINLSKSKDTVTVSFSTYGDPIKNKDMVFEKNYRENEARRGLGIGLYMVKDICEKYGVTYDLKCQDKQNIFSYTFKTI